MTDTRDTLHNEDGDGQVPSPSLERGLERADASELADESTSRRRQSSDTMSFGRWLLELAVLLVLAWALAWGIKSYVVQPFIIPSSSMEPTLIISDRVLVNRFIYRFTKPAPGDIVVFVSPEEGNIDLIKRVIAVGGQTIDIRDGKVFVDGTQRVEPFVNAAYPDHYDADAPFTVPEGSVYVMGDNRPNSKDSRYIGAQPVSRILGRAFAIYWPLGRLTWFR
ncbi:MAG: signal peptidase I [Coriobacteriia bacterium]|nr:signal peptidase I [Coriobacteriia bacterium]